MKFGEMQDKAEEILSVTKKTNALKREKEDKTFSKKAFLAIGALSSIASLGAVGIIANNPNYEHNTAIATAGAALFALVLTSAYKLVAHTYRIEAIDHELKQIRREGSQVKRELKHGGIEVDANGRSSIVDKNMIKRERLGTQARVVAYRNGGSTF